MLAKKPPTQKLLPIQRMIGSLIVLGTLLGVQVGAEPMVAGQVRLASGEPVAGAQVRLFNLSDLRSWVGATTDETGYFALPLGALLGAACKCCCYITRCYVCRRTSSSNHGRGCNSS